MLVAFVSSCTTIFYHLSKAINANYPNISFIHFEKPEDFLSANLTIFSHLIYKITEKEKENSAFKNIRKRYPQIKTIALAPDSNFPISSAQYGKFDFVFIDKEIDNKLNNYFYSLSSNNKLEPDPLNFDVNARRYINLHTALSQCLFQIWSGKSTKQIGDLLNKSPKTIEKYVKALKSIFKVESKKELVEIYDQVSKIDQENSMLFS